MGFLQKWISTFRISLAPVMLPVISRDNIICYFKGMTGHNIDFCGDLPSRASEIQLSALEKCYVL